MSLKSLKTMRGVLRANLLRFAGSDTTAIAFRAVFYFLMKNPTVYEQLMQEIDDAAERRLVRKIDLRIVRLDQYKLQPAS